MTIVSNFLALDIETTGLDPWRDKIHMCGLFDGERYVAVRTPWQLRNLLGTLYKDRDIIGHRTDFDIKFLLVQGWVSREDLSGRTIHDSRIMGSLVKNRVPKTYLDQYNEDRKVANSSLPRGTSHREGSPLSLKTMAPWYLKVPPFWETPGDHNNEEYNEKDCLYTYRLGLLLGERLKEEGSWDFYMRMLGWQQMTMEMEIMGIRIDLEELDKVEAEYIARRDSLRQKLDELWKPAHEEYLKIQKALIENKYSEMVSAALIKRFGKDQFIISDGPIIDKAHALRMRYLDMAKRASVKIETFNYSSPKQMTWLLKDYLGLDITNADDEESTGKAVLNKLVQDGREDIKTYLEWREADKVLTMYIPTYRSLHVDGVIHPSLNITGTRTGRLSSSSPNMQQVSPKLYRLFRPREGYKFIQYDLSGIEAALIALYSGEKKLYGILEKGESIHDHNAKAMFDLECAVTEVSERFPRERIVVKNIGFACFYGAGWRRISQVFAAGGFPITDAQAKEKLKLLKSYYPQVFEFHREITEVFERGETVYNLLGRPITLQEHDNPYMQGFNTLIQSSASDLNVEACYRFYVTRRYASAPLLMIHDCIIAEAKANGAYIQAADLEHHMTNFKLESVNGPIQLRVEGGVSDAWEK